MARVIKLSRAVVLSLSLCHAGCTSSPEKDAGATAVGAGVGAILCVVTLIACPVVLVAGASGGMLVRKANVSQYNACMRGAPKREKAYRAREEYCKGYK